MSRTVDRKMSRQEQRKEALDGLLWNMENGRIRDFYDYIKCAIPVLNQNPGSDRIFSRWLKKKADSTCTTVQEYIAWGAEKLTEEMAALERWYEKDPWKLDGSPDEWKEMWRQTLNAWWEDDTFPALSDKSVLCGNRDVLLYVLVALGFTTDESDEFLDEYSLVKNRDYLRRLYSLDFKEALFRWFLSWNEHHPEQPVCYHEICRYYEVYSTRLLASAKAELDRVCAEIADVICVWEKELKEWKYHNEAAYKKVLSELKELKAECSKVRNDLEKGSQCMYEHLYAEKVKGALTIQVHASRTLGRKKQELKQEEFEHLMSPEKRLYRISSWNDGTYLDRGTDFAWKQLMKYAGPKCEDLEESFAAFMKESELFLSDAYWRQFSQIMKLLGASGGNKKKNESFVREIRFSAETRNPNLYKDAGLFKRKNERLLSFAYNSAEINRALSEGTANGIYISSLLQPVWRNSDDMFSKTEVDSSAGFSVLRRNYEKWCQGKSGPYKAYTRKMILKLALAAGIEDMKSLQETMSLAGSGRFNYLDRSEAMVYLIVRYRDTLRKKMIDISDCLVTIEDLGIHTAAGHKAWEKVRELEAHLPEEYSIHLPAEMKKEFQPSESMEEIENAFMEASETWTHVVTEEKPMYSLVEYLHMSDRLLILFEASASDGASVRKKLFYGPYTSDFKNTSESEKRTGVARELAWVNIQNAWCLLLKDALMEEGVRRVFEVWYEKMKAESFSGLSSERWMEHLDLVEQRIGQIKKYLDIHLEVAYSSKWRPKLMGECNAIAEYLEQFHQAIFDADFMRQSPNASETKFVLEQWMFALAILELLSIRTERSAAYLKEYVFHWIAVGGMHNFSYRYYKNRTGFTEVGSRRYDRMESEDSEAIFAFWNGIYFDYQAIVSAIRWFQENRPEQSVRYEEMLRSLQRKIMEAAEQDPVDKDIEEKLEVRNGPFDYMEYDWRMAGKNLITMYGKQGTRKTETDRADKERVEEFRKRYRWFYQHVGEAYE
ncbi:MAG: hypothetical protein IJ374_06420 [Lachnospiraceae bacterium]|nr:hypothetical protein [Lachnospiraceae bacterium]